jgi:hypothetical protein
MIKEDNDLLHEWIAYHYTVLPLRYLVIGSDTGNTHDPDTVLQRWKDTDLHYWHWNASMFAHKYPTIHKGKSNTADIKKRAHHEFINRQKGFVSKCSTFLKEQGVAWTVFIDSDEFVVLNRLDSNERLLTDTGLLQKEELGARRDLPPPDSDDATVAHVLQTLQAGNNSSSTILHRSSSCITMPRLLVGALENKTCSAAAPVHDLARHHFRHEAMSTLRFVQHAAKGDFSASKFGKVLMDLSAISPTALTQQPRNIHRPYKSECGPAVVPYPDAIFTLFHYIGTWERYSSRQDHRRNRGEWEARAYFDEGVACDEAVHTWLPRFIAMVGGIDKARFLLGVVDAGVR